MCKSFCFSGLRDVKKTVSAYFQVNVKPDFKAEYERIEMSIKTTIKATSSVIETKYC